MRGTKMPKVKNLPPNFHFIRRPDGFLDVQLTGNPRSRPPTVTEVCDEYIELRKSIVRSPNTLSYSFNPIKRHLGSTIAHQITQTMVNRYITQRRKDRPEREGARWGNKPVGDATINKELRMLRAALNWAASEARLKRHPRFRIEITSGDVRKRWIEKAQLRKLVDECPAHVALFIIVAIYTSRRREAILSLTWDDVWLIPAGHEKIDFGADRGMKRRGICNIAGMTRLIEALKVAKARAKSAHVIEFRNKPIRDPKTALSAACRKIGMQEIGAHVLKHTAISWMVQDGVPYDLIAHHTNTSREMIEKHYGHHSATTSSTIAAALEF